MLPRLWVQIPPPFTGWTFFTNICSKNCNVCLKRQKQYQKEAEDGTFKKTKDVSGSRGGRVVSIFTLYHNDPSSNLAAM